MALRAEDEQAADGLDLLGLLVTDGLVLLELFGVQRTGLEYVPVVGVGIACCIGYDLLGKAGLAQIVLCKVLCIAAEHDIGTAARHVRRNGDCAELTGLCNNLGLLFVVLCVENVVLDAACLQKLGEVFALFNGYRTDQNGLTLLMAGDYLLDNGSVLAGLGLVNNVGLVDTSNGLVGRDLDDIELVDRRKLLFLRDGCTCHAGKLVVKSEIVLEGNSRKGLVLALDIDMLLGLYRLMQTLAVAAAKHDTACELIDDEHLAVLHDVVYITLHDAVGTQRLIYVVGEGRVFDIGVVFEVKCTLRLGNAACRERRGTRLFVYDVVCVEVLVLLLLGVGGGVDLFSQTRDEVVCLTVKVGALVALAGDDERRSRLVDEDRVHLVNDGKGMAALHAAFLIDRHVVTQVVKAHLVVRAVGDVGSISCLALLVVQTVNYKADIKTHESVYLAHPLAVASGEVIVDGDDMDSVAGYGVEVCGHDRNEGLAFAGLHLGDTSLMQDDAADELDAERLHAEHTPCGLAHCGKSLGQHGIEILTVIVAVLELGCLGAQLRI